GAQVAVTTQVRAPAAWCCASTPPASRLSSSGCANTPISDGNGGLFMAKRTPRSGLTGAEGSDDRRPSGGGEPVDGAPAHRMPPLRTPGSPSFAHAAQRLVQSAAAHGPGQGDRSPGTQVEGEERGGEVAVGGPDPVAGGEPVVQRVAGGFGEGVVHADRRRVPAAPARLVQPPGQVEPLVIQEEL